MWHKSLQDLKLSDTAWSWVSYPNSLTEYLTQQAGQEDLIIRLLGQHWRMPTHEEQQRLALTNNITENKVLERKIVMTVMNRPWIYAKTYFNQEASNLLGNHLRKLGNNSLGLLMANLFPNISRGHFEFAYFDQDTSEYKNIINHLASFNYRIDTAHNIIRNKLLVRRSLFYTDSNISNKQQALFNIDEVFLPELINKILNLEVII